LTPSQPCQSGIGGQLRPVPQLFFQARRGRSRIFGDLGLLKNARGIGLFFGWAGRAMMLAGLVWAAWIMLLQRARLSDSPFAEENRE